MYDTEKMIDVASNFTKEYTIYVDKLFASLIKTLWPSPMPPALMASSAKNLEQEGRPLVTEDPIFILRQLAAAGQPSAEDASAA